ncbi:hypothetical protein BDZ89DRAFT_1051082 [Hymenopellis radicata]|nr:hypothetical protein BDZ89DRAFT_1051082 [Hymenopellis radicata]
MLLSSPTKGKKKGKKSKKEKKLKKGKEVEKVENDTFKTIKNDIHTPLLRFSLRRAQKKAFIKYSAKTVWHLLNSEAWEVSGSTLKRGKGPLYYGARVDFFMSRCFKYLLLSNIEMSENLKPLVPDCVDNNLNVVDPEFEEELDHPDEAEKDAEILAARRAINTTSPLLSGEHDVYMLQDHHFGYDDPLHNSQPFLICTTHLALIRHPANLSHSKQFLWLHPQNNLEDFTLVNKADPSNGLGCINMLKGRISDARLNEAAEVARKKPVHEDFTIKDFEARLKYLIGRLTLPASYYEAAMIWCMTLMEVKKIYYLPLAKGALLRNVIEALTDGLEIAKNLYRYEIFELNRSGDVPTNLWKPWLDYDKMGYQGLFLVQDTVKVRYFDQKFE